MKKIETLDELIAEKKRLNALAKQMEGKIQQDLRYFSNRIQPLLSVFDGSNSTGKMSSLLLKGATAIVPLILSRRKTNANVPKASPWIALGSTALGLLADGLANGLVEKVEHFIGSLGKKNKNRKHRKHRLRRCK